MMKIRHLLLSLMGLLLFSQYAFSQDMILKRNDEIIKCKIKEIGLEEVKYALPDYPSDLLFVVDKDAIAKVVFADGKEMTFEKTMTDPNNYLDNKKNAFKVDFLSPLTGNTTFWYERSLKPGRSLEAALGIIGLGIDQNDENPTGVFARFGYKFIKDPDFYMRGMRYAHLLKGSYIKPEISLGFLSRNVNNYYEYMDPYGYYYGGVSKEREKLMTGSIQLTLGKQWIVDNVFLVDLYWGVGYGFAGGDNGGGYYYSYAVADESFPLAFSLGIKTGFLFK